MLHKKRVFAFHTDLSRIFQPKISCAVFSFPAFSRPALLCHIFQSRIFQPCSFVPHFPFLHFPALHFSLCRIFMSRIFSRPAEFNQSRLQALFMVRWARLDKPFYTLLARLGMVCVPVTVVILYFLDFPQSLWYLLRYVLLIHLNKTY